MMHTNNCLIQSEMKIRFKKSFGFTVIITLCLSIATLFIVIGCEKPGTSSISGIWKVKAINISGELTNIGPPPDNASYPNISIEIPEETEGSIEGHTFYNTIGFSFEIRENQQISCKDYGGTRSAEDEWGGAFGDHIMFHVVRFNISSNELKFLDSNDEPIIIFVKAN